MIAALICVISLAALSQFFVTYCWAALASTRHVQISERVREITRMAGTDVAADDFRRLLQFIFLCPQKDGYGGQVRAVALYYRLLRAIGFVGGLLIPGTAAWAERGCRECSHFAAVVLEHRIANMQNLVASQSGSLL